MATSNPRKTPIPIWLDVDTGHDDAFALLLAAQHPNLHLLGVSTTFGNAPLSKTTYNTRAVLKAIGREDVPVYAGASKPFCRKVVHAPSIHGESGLDGTTCLPDPDVESRGDAPGDAVRAMAEALGGTERGSAWLVPTGALTNTALLFALYSDLAEHLAGVSIMGGAIGGGFAKDAASASGATLNGEVEGGGGERIGNFTPYAEFNVYIDPEAAKAVLESNETLAKKTTLVGLDLTHQFLASRSVQEMLRTPSSGAAEMSTVRRLFAEILTFFTQTYASIFGISAGPPVHDLLAVAAVLIPEVFDDRGGERFGVSVVTEGAGKGSQLGRTVARKVDGGDGGVRIPRGVEAEKVWKELVGALGRAEEAEWKKR